MNDAKYIGLDVHQATISAAVLDSAGKLGRPSQTSVTDKQCQLNRSMQDHLLENRPMPGVCCIDRLNRYDLSGGDNVVAYRQQWTSVT